MVGPLSQYLIPLVVGSATATPLCNHTGSYNSSNSTVNAVLAYDFPDPTLIETGGVWYAFATSGNNKNVQAAVSGDFLEHEWRLLEDVDALPDAGPWAKNENIWAPDMIQMHDSKFVMYYSAPVKGSNATHCVGAATSNNILGPYEPSEEPIACPIDQGGAIDPAGFVDPRSEALYVVYKVDGNNINGGGGLCNGGGDPKMFNPTPIMLQKMNADGVTPEGEPFKILDRGEHDGPLIEAPSLFYREDYDMYYLTFSSNCYSTDNYDISFAYSKDLHSTFCKTSSPLMTTGNGPIRAPGGADVSEDGRFALFHGTVATNERGEPIRHMFAAEAEQIGIDMNVWPV